MFCVLPKVRFCGRLPNGNGLANVAPLLGAAANVANDVEMLADGSVLGLLLSLESTILASDNPLSSLDAHGDPFDDDSDSLSRKDCLIFCITVSSSAMTQAIRTKRELRKHEIRPFSDKLTFGPLGKPQCAILLVSKVDSTDETAISSRNFSPNFSSNYILHLTPTG